MADVNITPIIINKPNVAPTAFAFTSVGTSDTAIVSTDACKIDERATFIFTTSASGGAVITVKAGNGYAANKDLAINVESGKFTAIKLDTARFDNNGKIKFTTSASATMAVVAPR